jgi:hypothetical protein
MFDVDVERVPLHQLEDELCAWAGRIAAVTCAWLLGLAAFDRRKGWAGVGIRSCAHWLSWRCGLGLRAGYEHLRVAHALERLPALREAFAAGRLSYSKTRAIARVAEPATEAEWVRQAGLCTASQLEHLASVYARLNLPGRQQTTRRQTCRRCTWRWDDDGNLILHAVLPPELGAIVLRALDAAGASLHDTHPPADPDQPDEKEEAAPAGGQLAVRPRDRAADADALAAVAEGFLAAGPPALADPNRYTVTVHVDADVLAVAARDADPADPADPAARDADPADPADPAARDADPAGQDASTPTGSGPCTGPAEPDRPARRPLTALRCDVEPGGVGLSPDTVRRLACNATLRALIVDRDGNPLDLGRRRRTPSDRLRAAVYARDRGVCQYPGCEHSRWLHIHHLEHWADHGKTALPNLILLCGYHHAAVHEGGITLHRDDDGTVTARHPQGWTIHPAPCHHPGPEPATHVTRGTSHINRRAIIPDWAGDPLHLADSIHALVSKLPDAGCAEMTPAAA